ncbi:Muskelin 1, intracellular mediator containing kelch motif [Ceratobasidium sp. 394]|nr:Muskelin 1, intracellular mediator containing kelch motif [Ceratobasidium sp. 394]KAG9098279.1 Muskelin 1, intracellular mediator containing kelch motif [Ceratobasidium sp. UAMH 11750]
MTTLPNSSLPPSVPLLYTIEGCSSYSSKYTPDNILIDRPEDANSRWTTERIPNPDVKESHWVMLRLDQMSVVLTITFGKFKQSHPCNISSFRVFGGLGTKDHEMRELLSAKLSDDGIPQTFSLNHTTSNSGVTFPCRYIKICPLSAHGKSYNMSIWHIALAGITTPSFVKEIHNNFVAHKNNQALYLILKHLRQNNFLAAHSALLAQTNIRPEHPRVTELHDALVLNGDLAKAEDLVGRMVREDKLFDYCARVSPPACAWKRVTPDGPAPPGRGGHQLCMDVENRIIYLFGGWDGSKNLADFWSYSIVDGRWTMLSEDTCADGGPSARSCHNMVFSLTNGNIYVLGQLKDAPKAGASPRPQRGDGDFFVYSTRGPGSGRWTLLNPGGVETAGGPPSLSDHQMAVDEARRLLYVFGGRVDNPSERDGQQLYSGMYSFHMDSQMWTHVFPDPIRPEGLPNRVNIHSRTGHGMVIYPQTHEIFIVGGRRSNNKYLPDMHSFSPATRTSQRLAFDPAIANAASAPRVCIDEDLGEIYVLIWQNSERDRDRTRVANAEPATFATYHITEKRWVRSEPRLGPFKNVSGGGDVWEGLELPRPRSAHQVVYDPTSKTFHMFGGNSGEDGIPRLNDLWSMRLIRPEVDELLRKALLAVRKFRFKKMCNTAPPFEALTYLQTRLAEVVDQADEDESAELRKMLSYLLGKTTNGNSEMGEHGENGQQAEESERRERRELFDFLMQFVSPDQREPETELSDIVENI